MCIAYLCLNVCVYVCACMCVYVEVYMCMSQIVIVYMCVCIQAPLIVRAADGEAPEAKAPPPPAAGDRTIFCVDCEGNGGFRIQG